MYNFQQRLCCIQRITIKMLMYKNISCFFLFFFIIRNVHMGRVWACQRGLKCTQARATVQFFCETSLPFCFILPGSKFFPGLYNFLDTHVIPWPHLLPMRSMLTCLLYSVQPTQHFLWGKPESCLPKEISGHPVKQPMHYFRRDIIRLTLGNRCISCHATHATYAACQRNLPVAIQQLHQVYFLMFFLWCTGLSVNIFLSLGCAGDLMIKAVQIGTSKPTFFYTNALGKVKNPLL